MIHKLLPDTEVGSATEDIIDAFEAAWRTDHDASPEILQFLGQVKNVQTQGSEKNHLASELVKIDLEYSWKTEPPGKKIEDYLNELGRGSDRIQFTPRQLSELIAEEYRVRIRWGDRPTRESFAERFGHFQLPIDDLLCEQESEVNRELIHVEVRVYDDGDVVYSGELACPFVIGRQRRGEPGPFSIVDSEKQAKLIIATRDQSFVSRNHIRVASGDPSELILENLSTRQPVQYNHTFFIAPGEREVVDQSALLLIGRKIPVRIIAL